MRGLRFCAIQAKGSEEGPGCEGVVGIEVCGRGYTDDDHVVVQETGGSWEQGPEVGSELDATFGEYDQAVVGRRKAEGRRTFHGGRGGFHGVRDQRGFQERRERKGRVVYQDYSNPPCQLKLAFHDRGLELTVLEPRRRENGRDHRQERAASVGEGAGNPVGGFLVDGSFRSNFGRNWRDRQAYQLGHRQFSSRSATGNPNADNELQEGGLGVRAVRGGHRGRGGFNSGGRQRFLEGRPQGHPGNFR